MMTSFCPFSGEGWSPVSKAFMTKRTASQSMFPTWAPAFAEEEQERSGAHG
ncbi:MAG: hypothetical protein KJ549_01135 [Alphaproteobacteria bacterium]|nr:hypothetical protein [Alphaproteobacteria bacterium]